VLEAELLAGLAEGSREITRAVIGPDALDLDAEACVIGDGRLKEGDCALFPLVLHHPAEGDARCIADTNMDELPTDTEVAVDHTGSSSRDPMPHALDPAELLDIDMDELTRVLPLIATDGLQLQSTQLVQAQPPQHGGGGHAERRRCRLRLRAASIAHRA
jgi:hypothetical protein